MKIRRILLTVAMALALATIACNTSIAMGKGPVSIKNFGRPFGPRYMPGRWVQRIAIVQNRTDSPRRVEVQFPSKDSQGATYEYSRIVLVPPHTQRRLRLCAKPDGLKSKSGKKSAGVEETAVLYDVTNANLTKWLDNSIYPLNAIESNQTIIATVGRIEEGDTQSFLGKLKNKPLGNVDRAGATIYTLPDRWYGFSIVDILILNKMDVTSLRPTQIDAILGWVHRGGVLILAGNTSLPQILDGPLGSAAGVAGGDTHQITSLSLQQPNKKIPGKTRLYTPLPRVELIPDTAEVVYATDDMPLMTHRNVGAGHVFVLAVPIGAFQDESLHFVFRPIYNAAKRTLPPLNASAFQKPARDTLNEIAGRRGPTKLVPLIVLGVLIVLSVAGGLLLRLRRRGELAWVVMTPLAIICGVVLFFIGMSGTEAEKLTYVGLLSGMEDGTARAQSVIAYYSGPNQQELTFTAGSEQGVIEDIAIKTDSTLARGKTVSDASVNLPDRIVQTNTTAAIAVDTIIRTKGLSGTLTFDESGLSGQLTNHFEYDITTAVVYVNQQTYSLGDLPAGRTTKISISDADWRGRVTFELKKKNQPTPTTWEQRPKRPRRRPGTRPAQKRRPPRRRPRNTKSKKTGKDFAKIMASGEFIDLDALSDFDKLRNDLVEQIVTAPQMGRTITSEIVLIGYANKGPIDPLPGRDLSRDGWWIVVWPLKLTSPTPGSRVVIPSAFVKVKLGNIKNRLINPFGFQNRDLTCHVYANPPRQVSQLEKTKAKLTIGILAPRYRVTVNGISPDGSVGPEIGQAKSPAGEMSIEIDNADPFRQQDGSYGFQISVERIDAPEKGNPGGNSAKWNFDSIDVSLEGISR